MKKIAIGCDPNAAGLKDVLKSHLSDRGYRVEDFGNDDPIYANVAIDVAEKVAAGEFERGVLLCGTGIGVSLAANKVDGAYAAVATDAYSVERSVKSNNANILTFGAQVMGPETAKMLVDIWLGCEYEPGGRSAP
ncbi:MAG: RpiB/LacA/LacB family sugar-phosphate isomerase, partial [Rhodospirillales bacterium]|nr:RpiB/LacA/LacB family sugar-phosphate isomerase [Rhodospirillales bacterium]